MAAKSARWTRCGPVSAGRKPFRELPPRPPHDQSRPEEELRNHLVTIQERTYKLRDLAMNALMDLIADIKQAKVAGATDEQLAPARELQRHSQFYLDFVESENSMGFHAPQEAKRVLGESIDLARKGHNAVHQFNAPKVTSVAK